MNFGLLDITSSGGNGAARAVGPSPKGDVLAGLASFRSLVDVLTSGLDVTGEQALVDSGAGGNATPDETAVEQHSAPTPLDTSLAASGAVAAVQSAFTAGWMAPPPSETEPTRSGDARTEKAPVEVGDDGRVRTENPPLPVVVPVPVLIGLPTPAPIERAAAGVESTDIDIENVAPKSLPLEPYIGPSTPDHWDVADRQARPSPGIRTTSPVVPQPAVPEPAVPEPVVPGPVAPKVPALPEPFAETRPPQLLDPRAPVSDERVTIRRPLRRAPDDKALAIENGSLAGAAGATGNDAASAVDTSAAGLAAAETIARAITRAAGAGEAAPSASSQGKAEAPATRAKAQAGRLDLEPGGTTPTTSQPAVTYRPASQEEAGRQVRPDPNATLAKPTSEAAPMLVTHVSTVPHVAFHSGPSIVTVTAESLPVWSGRSLPDMTTADIVQAIRLQAIGNGGEARIRLEPSHFGELTVSVRVDQGQVVARLHAESPVVREWLQTNQGWLRQQLAEHQLTLDRFEVIEPAAEPEQADQRHEDERERHQDRPGRRPHRDDTGERFEVVA